MTSLSLTQDALAIWNAGVDAVRPQRLIPREIACDERTLSIRGEEFTAADWDRIVVVGAGKAGGTMAEAVEAALNVAPWREKLTGWVNVPADCLRPTQRIRLHAARPAAVNEPTDEGVAGTREILRLAASCGPRDLCLVLISGGGSALLPAPAEGLSLREKQQITRDLMAAGMTINELNCVRKQLSDVKGGRLAQAARNAGRTLALIISDVVGDPLDVIASGPTVEDSSTVETARDILRRCYGEDERIPAGARAVLQRRRAAPVQQHTVVQVTNHVLASNAIALGAAQSEAERRGYHVVSLGSANQGTADTAGGSLAERLLTLRTDPDRVCLLSGGEPTVTLVPTDQPRKGGRNQQLILSALCRWWTEDVPGLVLLSGGTDGEDGPTDAAGAFVDAAVIASARDRQLDPGEFRDRQNAYPFFEQTGGLLKTGPTGTNVMDLRVGLAAQ